MSKQNDGGPAFPVPDNYARRGMSLRDWFAGLAMQALVSSHRLHYKRAPDAGEEWVGETNPAYQVLAEDSVESDLAYKIADSMLIVRDVEDAEPE